MKNRLFAILIAFSCFSGIAAVNANAMVGYNKIDNDGNVKDINGYTYEQIICADALDYEKTDKYNKHLSDADKMYIRTDGKELLAYYRQSDYISIIFNDTNINTELLTNILNDTDESIQIYIDQPYGSITNITDIFTAKKIMQEINDLYPEATLEFYHKPYIIENRKMPSKLAYNVTDEEAITEYISNNGLKIDIINVNNYIQLIPENELSASESLEFENQLYNSIGIKPVYSILEGTKGSCDDKILFDDSINGDANLDGEVTLADSLTVLQYIANEEKYPLNEKQQFNADCYNPGDGITAMDALEIQMINTKK